MNTWVFLRGWTRERRHWGDFPALFSDSLTSTKVVCLDWPGNGELHRMASPVRMADMLAHCRGALRAMNQAPPFYLLGLSMGAMAAVAWMERHPGEVAGGVLLNASLRGVNPFYHRLRPRAWPDLCRLLLADSRQKEEIIFRLTSAQHALDSDTIRAWTEYRLRHPVSVSNALRQLRAAIGYRPTCDPCAAPPLLLAGAADRLVNPVCSLRLARRWNAPLKVHACAGHDLPLDDGRWVVQQVDAWLAARQAFPRMS